MNKAVFLDRDGTINVEKHYLYKIEDFEFLPGVIQGLKLLQDAGYLLIIVTNQSGIGRGYYKKEDFLKLNQWMLDTLNRNGVNITKFYYCPHLPDAQIEEYRKDCECRKPKLGMYYMAIKEFNIDVSRSYTVGDKIRDCAICEKTVCKGYLIANNEKEGIIRKVKNGKVKGIQYAYSLLECAKMIVS
jgi:D-glycero-D-manno-heptose 1,7-bisphosphate phosphatase